MKRQMSFGSKVEVLQRLGKLDSAAKKVGAKERTHLIGWLRVKLTTHLMQ